MPTRRASSASLTARLAGVPEDEQEGVVIDLVRSHVAAVLGHSSAGAIEPDRAFNELGLDSLAAVEIRNRLDIATGMRLPATAVFDYPTPAALANYLREASTQSRRPALTGALTQIEEEVVSMSPDEPDRAELVVRLRAFVARLDSQGPSDESHEMAQVIDSASDDELFELVDRELGG
jgi:acyl carrier protein